MSDEDLKRLIEFNAQAIQALTEELKTYQREAQLDRARLYEAIADLYKSQAFLSFAPSRQFQQSQIIFLKEI